MNSLPTPIQYKIYEYVHQLNYANTIDKLKSIRIECLKMDLYINCRMFMTNHHSNLFEKCLAIDCLSTTSFEILKTIRNNKY